MIDYNKLQSEMQRLGFAPQYGAEKGRFHRFDRNGRKGVAWYVESDDYACFGDWHTGEKYAYVNDDLNDEECFLTPEEEAELKRQRKELHKRIEAERLKAEREQSVSLRLMMQSKCRPYAPTDYCRRKQIKGDYPDVLTTESGNLIIPMSDGKDGIATAQQIAPDGGKKYYPGISTKGKGYIFHGSEERIILCEGWATGASIHEATGWTVVCAMSAGNLRPILETHGFFTAEHKARTWLCADWDDPPETWTDSERKTWPKGTGQRKAEETNLPAERIAYPPERGDFNDFACGGGDLKAWLESKTAEPKIRGVGWLLKNRQPMGWLLKGMIPRQSIGFFYGLPGALKTTVVLDIIASLSHGINWQGRKSKPAKVLYLCGEGEYGFLNRCEAWQIRNRLELDDERFRVYRGGASIAVAIAEYKAADWTPDLIVADTWARYYKGEENSAQESGRIIDLMSSERQRCGVSWLIIHHAGKPSPDRPLAMRGSSALDGAADYVFFVRKAKDERGRLSVELECQKMKDAEEPQPMRMAAEVVELGQLDEYGEPVTALVVGDRLADQPAGQSDRLEAAETQLRIAYETYGVCADAVCSDDRLAISDLKRSLAAQGLSPSQITHWLERDPSRPFGMLEKAGIARKSEDGKRIILPEGTYSPF